MNILSDRVKQFSEIYSDLYPIVYNTVYAKISNKDMAGDLSQEIFTRFYEKMEEVENPRKWLFGALKNVVLEYYKKNSVDSVDIDEIFYDDNIQYVNGFRDTRMILQEALEASENYRDDQERTIYELIALNNYTYEEVASLMGLSKRQVNYKYKLVVDRIVSFLKKKGIHNLEELL